jgi:hypothetical protein
MLIVVTVGELPMSATSGNRTLRFDMLTAFSLSRQVLSLSQLRHLHRLKGKITKLSVGMSLK